MSFIKNIPFYFNFYKHHIIPEDLDKLYLNHNNTTIYNKKDKPSQNKALIYQFGLFPSYMGMELVNNTSFSKKTVTDRNLEGCAVVLDKFNSVQEYINAHYKKKGNFRNKINKNIKRLEICFDIKYKMYHGSISQNEYESLMESLKTMLASRFSQINKTNFALLKWNEFYESCFEMITNKKASLFVIYNNSEPINISLNYHYNNIMFGAVSSFDLNYSKFGLGHIQIYKLLDWCFANSYKVLDMCHGNLDYKKMWCNLIYPFESHVYYKKKSFIGLLLKHIVIYKIHIKHFLKDLKINLLYEKIGIAWKIRNNPKNSKQSTFNFNIETIESIDNNEEKKQLNISIVKSNYKYLLKPLYDFLYLNEEHIDTVEVFKQNNVTNIFYFIGRKKTAKINFKINNND